MDKVDERYKRKLTFTAILIIGAALLSCPFTACAQLDVSTIMQRSVEANDRDWKEAPSYDYYECAHLENVTKTYLVSLIGGSPYQRLVEIDGKPLPEQEDMKQQRKLEQVTAKRQSESQEDRTERLAKYQKQRKEIYIFLQELANAFEFRLVDDKDPGNDSVYILQATPRRGYKPPNNEAKVLSGMKARLWIDKATFQWVKVKAVVIHPVSIEGILARVEPGTQFELEKVQVSDGVWLPSHFSMKARAKVLFLVDHNTKEEENYFNYSKKETTPPATAVSQTQ